jgi:hypothetical protein
MLRTKLVSNSANAWNPNEHPRAKMMSFFMAEGGDAT